MESRSRGVLFSVGRATRWFLAAMVCRFPELNRQAQSCKASRQSHQQTSRHDRTIRHPLASPLARCCCARKSRCSICGTRPPLPPAIRCLPPTWRPTGSRSKPRRGCRARMCRSSSTTPAKALLPQAADRLAALGYTDVRQLDGGLQAWQAAGYELFQDVNSYAKAFGELVESRRHTPSLPADEVAALIAGKADIAILDVRRFDEYATMNIPGSVSVPGAELVLRAGRVAPDPETTIIVNCAGRTRSIIGTQSLINAGVANKVVALRNGTIGWTLARQDLEHGADRRGGDRPVRGRAGKCPRRRLSRRRPASRPGRSDGARGADPPHALSLRRSRRGRICGRSHPRLSPLSRAGSWSRRSTWPRRCAARASC